jgi:hypothetical protein
MRCGCGNAIDFQFLQLACMDCGTGCCPTCAVYLESVTYCEACAQSLLGGAPVRPGGQFELH